MQGLFFTITSANVNHPLNQITLQWNAETGFLYSIWASSDLLNWTNLAANLSTSGSSILLTTNDPALGSAQRYYRIGVNRP